MLVHALVATVGANPEPTVFAVFDGRDKELADLVCGTLLVALLGQDNGPQLFLVPVCRRLLLLGFLFVFSLVCVKVLLLRLALHRQVVSKLALFALFAVALPPEDTDDGLGVDTKGYLLDLRRTGEEESSLPLGVFGGLLVALALELLGFLLLLLDRAAALEIARHLSNLPLRLGTFLVLHAKGTVLHNLGGRGLVLGGGLLVFLGRHAGRLAMTLAGGWWVVG